MASATLRPSINHPQIHAQQNWHKKAPKSHRSEGFKMLLNPPCRELTEPSEPLVANHQLIIRPTLLTFL